MLWLWGQVNINNLEGYLYLNNIIASEVINIYEQISVLMG